jgi:hypothetical protein
MEGVERETWFASLASQKLNVLIIHAAPAGLGRGDIIDE